MAAGGGLGVWQCDEFPNKLLIPIAGTPLIVRAVEQVRYLSRHEPIVLTHWPEVQEIVPLYLEPEHHGGYVETFMSAREVWKVADRTVVLNGDMVWHPNVLEFILSHRGSPALYGDSQGQIYAWAFNVVDVVDIVYAALYSERTRRSYSQVHFFRLLCGVSQLKEAGYFYAVPEGTYTRDFDIPKDYESWLENGPVEEQQWEKQADELRATEREATDVGRARHTFKPRRILGIPAN
jgi:hypothetical protein